MRIVRSSSSHPLSPCPTIALRGILRVAMLGLVIAAASGCDKKSESTPATSAVPTYRFAFVTNNSSDFWNIAEKGLRKAEKEFGVKVDIFRPLKGEIADQQRFLEDIMVRNFDGVAISPINPDAMTEMFDRVAAKMPLICHDSDAPKSKRRVYIGTNNVEAGRAAGTAAIDALKAANITKGKIAIFVGRIDAQNAIERKQGVDETLGKLAGFEILPIYLDKTDRAQAKKNVEDALARHADLALLVGLWSYNGPAMAGAVRASSRAQKPVMIAFDEEEETLKAVEDGAVYATIVQRPFEFGYQSVKALKDLKEGKTVPPVIDTGILTVDKANVAKFWSELRELKQ